MNSIMAQWWRLGGVMAIAFVVVFIVVGFGIQGEPPAYDDSIDEIRAYWEDDGERYLIGNYLLGLASLLLLLPFLVCFKTMLARAERDPQIWSQVAFAGGIILVAIAAASTASWVTLAFAAEELEDESLRLLMFLDTGAWNAFPYAVGTLVLASSLVIIQTGVLWRWLGYLGLVVGIAAFITPLGILDRDPEDVFDSIGLIVFLGFAIWLLITGIGMVMKKEEPGVASTAM